MVRGEERVLDFYRCGIWYQDEQYEYRKEGKREKSNREGRLPFYGGNGIGMLYTTFVPLNYCDDKLLLRTAYRVFEDI